MMQRKIVSFFVLTMLAALFVSGCASSSAVMVGTARPPINSRNVRVLAELPPQYEIIALVTASCDMGWTEQDDHDLIMEELKAKTASLGANAVLVENIDSRVEYHGAKNPKTKRVISGKALYVYEPEPQINN